MFRWLRAFVDRRAGTPERLRPCAERTATSIHDRQSAFATSGVLAMRYRARATRSSHVDRIFKLGRNSLVCWVHEFAKGNGFRHRSLRCVPWFVR